MQTRGGSGEWNPPPHHNPYYSDAPPPPAHHNPYHSDAPPPPAAAQWSWVEHHHHHHHEYQAYSFSHPPPPPPPQIFPSFPPQPHDYYPPHTDDFYSPHTSHDPLPSDARIHYPSLLVTSPSFHQRLPERSSSNSLPIASDGVSQFDPQYCAPGFQPTAPYPPQTQPARVYEGWGVPSSPYTDGESSSPHFPAGQHHQFESQSSSESGSWSHSGHFDWRDPASANGAVVPHSGTLVESLSSKRSLKFVLLYGTLELWLHSATNLPNMDLFSEGMRQALITLDPSKKTIPVVHQRISQLTHTKITSDPYVCVVLKGATIARTRVVSNNQDPVWDEHFVIPVAHKVAEVELVVKDNDLLGAQFIGETKIPAQLLLTEQVREQHYELLTKDGKPCRAGAQIKVSLKYCAVEDDPLYKYGVGAGPDYRGVPKTYFPLHRGGRVKLYQDAHVPDNCLPQIKLDNGIRFEHGKCWEDICQAILDAQHMVYIAGWSIYTQITLVRTTDKCRSKAAYKTLGELLKQKADAEAVRVLLLVWDDKTSHSVINNVGVMGTHDEETRRFFKHSNVHCLLAPRYADSKLSWVKQQVVGTLYTHHQKIVIVDAQGPRNKRNLVVFLGGIDLCHGRYDTPQHTLFRNFDTVFKDDYHNSTFPKADSGGPRQPWHDLHCKIEGPAVYDVLKNFEQRWKKASKWHGFSLSARSGIKGKYNFLVNLEQVPWINYPEKEGQQNDLLNVTREGDPETWHVQIFRSIDSGSVSGFPKTVLDAEKENLVGGKNIAIDTSIQTAYIKAIRSAQHFIYIENQYFIGSSFAWPKYKNAGANHLVPIELALKIVSKIKAKERFAVYVVIPMWPEGVPSSNSVQEILFFQGQTMEMMYTLIAEALREADLEEQFHPTDFLNFFCLGNREMVGENDPVSKVPPAEGSSQARVLKSRRFMVYVHAKGMIVDDEYVIIGSANINQRSMDGSRDTEIAMGAYQPYHSWAHRRAPPQGQVYGYRMSLWAEHLQVNHNCFMKPWSLECVKTVKAIAEGYWKQYCATEVTEMKGHLLPYPIKVEKNGKVVPLPDCEVFPDFDGKILGSSTNLPDSLTT